MQRSLLPREQPQAAGLDVGAVYESSARVDVGGDVYDFLELARRTARGRARRRHRPRNRRGGRHGDGEVRLPLARARAPRAGRLPRGRERGRRRARSATGKFITMLYVTVDGRDGRARLRERGPSAAAARARGRPSSRSASGASRSASRGDQAYEVERVLLEPGDAVVLYTDGVLEARRDGELYGDERLDAVAGRGTPGCRRTSSRTRSSRTAGPSAASSRTTAPSSSSSARDRARPAQRPALADRPSRRGGARARELARGDRGRARARLRPGRVRRPRGRRRPGDRARPAAEAAGLPALDDVLDLLRSAGSGVQLDLKSQRAERPVAEALRRHGLVERTIVSSFRPTTLRALHAVEPGLRLGRTYPQDRTGLTKRPIFQPPARAIVRVLRRALPRRIAGLLAGSPRDRRRPLLGGRERGRGGPLPRARRAGARLDG